MKSFQMVSTLAVLLALTVCVPASGGFKLKNPLDNLGIPDPIIDQLGGLMYATKIQTCTLCQREEDLARVGAVWKKLLSAAPQSKAYKNAKANKWDWEMALVEEMTVVDAEALPGGKVIVYTGASARTQADPAQTAFLIGHEMAHALARHAKSRFDKHTQTAVLTAVTGGALNASKLDPKTTVGVMAAMGVAYEGAAVTPFAKELEFEADRNALNLMAQAGYDPKAAVTFLNKIGKDRPGGKSFLADHPTIDKRIANLEKHMPASIEMFRKARGS